LRSQRPFLVLWTLAVGATVAAFVLHLALRGRTVDLGYQLGRARGDQARLREVRRVLELEAASYETPQRVEVVARTLLGMQPPSADRIVPVTGMAVSLPSAPAPAVSARTPGPSPTPTSEPWGAPPAGPRAER
jgi:cell division protein FtsL